jgi:hypothetical protein
MASYSIPCACCSAFHECCGVESAYVVNGNQECCSAFHECCCFKIEFTDVEYYDGSWNAYPDPADYTFCCTDEDFERFCGTVITGEDYPGVGPPDPPVHVLAVDEFDNPLLSVGAFSFQLTLAGYRAGVRLVGGESGYNNDDELDPDADCLSDNPYTHEYALGPWTGTPFFGQWRWRQTLTCTDSIPMVEPLKKKPCKSCNKKKGRLY